MVTKIIYTLRFLSISFLYFCYSSIKKINDNVCLNLRHNKDLYDCKIFFSYILIIFIGVILLFILTIELSNYLVFRHLKEKQE